MFSPPYDFASDLKLGRNTYTYKWREEKGGHQVRQRRGVRRFKFMHCQCEVNIDQGTWRFRCCVT